MTSATPRSSFNNSLKGMGLIAAMAMPVLYFATQLAAAPFYPGYSFSRDGASMLGTRLSLQPWIFNLGAILTGVTALLGAIGLILAFRTAAHFALAWLIGLCVVATGVMSIKAGFFPMPDPRHASWGFLVYFTIITPLLLLLGLWKQRDANAARIYLAASIALILLLFPFMFGMVSVAWLEPGALQRLFAIATFVPVGVVGYFFKREA